MSTNLENNFCMFIPASFYSPIDSSSNVSNIVDGSSKKTHPRSTFTENEDKILTKLVKEYGAFDWKIISQNLPGRNPRQCRDRWQNYLSPEIVNGPWSKSEEKLLIEKYEKFGPCWKKIATFFPTRTDINIKSRWNLIQRRLQKEDLQIKKEIFIQNFGQKMISESRSSKQAKLCNAATPNITDNQIVNHILKNSKQFNLGKISECPKKKKNTIPKKYPSKSERKQKTLINSSPLPFLSDNILNNANSEKILNENDIFDLNSGEDMNYILMKEELTNVFDSWF